MSKKKGDFCRCHFGSKIGFGIKFRTCSFSVRILEFSYPLRELSWTGKIKQAAVIILDAEYCLRHETPQSQIQRYNDQGNEHKKMFIQMALFLHYMIPEGSISKYADNVHLWIKVS